MLLTRNHIRFYKQNKFKVKSPLFKAFDKLEDISIHKLVNGHCDFESLLILNKNRPLDKDHKISNLYNLLRSINNRLSGSDLIEYLKQISYSDNKRKSIINKIIKRLES